MFIYDLCRKPLVEGKVKWVERPGGRAMKHICEPCIKVCVQIMKDPTTGEFTYLNEYKEKKGI